MGNLEGKVALVTGAGTGLGKAIAKRLAEQGATVALNGRREDRLQEVKQEIGDNALVFAADASDEKAVAQLIVSLKEQTGGKLDILVNNAGGVSVLSKVSDLTPTDWQKMLAINTTSQLVMTQACLPLLRESGNGQIISVTSGMVNYFAEGMGAYSASKAAAEALMKTVAVEEKENNVHVTLFDPINVVSEGNPDGQYAAMDVAQAVADLAVTPSMEKQGQIVKPQV